MGAVYPPAPDTQWQMALGMPSALSAWRDKELWKRQKQAGASGWHAQRSLAPG